MKEISCHECEYWLPDEEQCNYPDLPPCMDYLYGKQTRKVFEDKLNKTK